MSDNIVEQLIRLLKLDTLDDNQSLVFVREKTNLKPSQISLLVVVFVSIVLIFAQAAAFLISIICYFIPAYFTILCFESRQKNIHTKYITYWVIFVTTELISPLFSWILSPSIYTFLRIAMTLVLLHPQVNLAVQIYHRVVQPFVLKYQNQPLRPNLPGVPSMPGNPQYNTSVIPPSQIPPPPAYVNMSSKNRNQEFKDLTPKNNFVM